MDNPQTPTAKKNQGGRPKLPEKERRNCMVKVYFDAVNYAKLVKKHKRTGVSLSTLVYELAVNGQGTHIKGGGHRPSEAFGNGK